MNEGVEGLKEKFIARMDRCVNKTINEENKAVRKGSHQY